MAKLLCPIDDLRVQIASQRCAIAKRLGRIDDLLCHIGDLKVQIASQRCANVNCCATLAIYYDPLAI